MKSRKKFKIQLGIKQTRKFIIIYFSSERRHYDSFPDFTPSSDANWCLM